MSHYISLHILHQLEQLDKLNVALPLTLYPHSRLKMGQDYKVLGQIVDLSFRRANQPDIPEQPSILTHKLPEGVQIGTPGEQVIEESRGSELSWAHASDLSRIDVPAGEGAINEINRAVKAYLGQLASDTSVVIHHSF
jgi:hypothetical protein